MEFEDFEQAYEAAEDQLREQWENSGTPRRCHDGSQCTVYPQHCEDCMWKLEVD